MYGIGFKDVRDEEGLIPFNKRTCSNFHGRFPGESRIDCRRHNVVVRTSSGQSTPVDDLLHVVLGQGIGQAYTADKTVMFFFSKKMARRLNRLLPMLGINDTTTNEQHEKMCKAYERFCRDNKIISSVESINNFVASCGYVRERLFERKDRENREERETLRWENEQLRKGRDPTKMRNPFDHDRRDEGSSSSSIRFRSSRSSGSSSSSTSPDSSTSRRDSRSKPKSARRPRKQTRSASTSRSRDRSRSKSREKKKKKKKRKKTDRSRSRESTDWKRSSTPKQRRRREEARKRSRSSTTKRKKSKNDRKRSVSSKKEKMTKTSKKDRSKTPPKKKRDESKELHSKTPKLKKKGKEKSPEPNKKKTSEKAAESASRKKEEREIYEKEKKDKSSKKEKYDKMEKTSKSTRERRSGERRAESLKAKSTKTVASEVRKERKADSPEKARPAAKESQQSDAEQPDKGKPEAEASGKPAKTPKTVTSTPRAGKQESSRASSFSSDSSSDKSMDVEHGVGIGQRQPHNALSTNPRERKQESSSRGRSRSQRRRNRQRKKKSDETDRKSRKPHTKADLLGKDQDWRAQGNRNIAGDTGAGVGLTPDSTPRQFSPEAVDLRSIDLRSSSSSRHSDPKSHRATRAHSAPPHRRDTSQDSPVSPLATSDVDLSDTEPMSIGSEKTVGDAIVLQMDMDAKPPDVDVFPTHEDDQTGWTTPENTDHARFQPADPHVINTSEEEANKNADKRLRRWSRQFDWYQNEFLKGQFGPPPRNTPSQGSPESDLDPVSHPSQFQAAPTEDAQVEMDLDVQTEELAAAGMSSISLENKISIEKVSKPDAKRNDRKRQAPKKAGLKKSKPLPSKGAGSVLASVPTPKVTRSKYKETPPATATSSSEVVSGPERKKNRKGPKDEFIPNESAWTDEPDSPIARRIKERSTAAL